MSLPGRGNSQPVAGLSAHGWTNTMRKLICSGQFYPAKCARDREGQSHTNSLSVTGFLSCGHPKQIDTARLVGYQRYYLLCLWIAH